VRRSPGQNDAVTGIESVPGAGVAPAVTTPSPSETVESVEHADVAAPARDRWAWARRVTPWQVGLVAVITAYVAHFTKLTLDIHHGLGTSSYDFGLYDQGVWLLSRFHDPFVTLMGRNLFGDHTSFILVLLVPFYWLWPAAGTLLFSQSLLLGLGAVPVFLYARTRLASEWMALVLATAYLLHPAVGWTNLENFHPDSYLAVFVGFAIWAALTRRWKTYAVFVVLSLLVKEDVALLVVPLGVWVAIKRDRRIGLITIVGGIGFMAVAMLVVVRALIGTPTRNAWRFPFGGPTGFLRHAFRRPGDVLDHVWSDNRPWYVWQMLTPFAWMWARRPSVAAIGSLVLAGNVISTYWYQYNIGYHYSLIIVPPLALGTAYGIAAFHGRTRIYAVGIVGVVALYTAYLWGPMPFARAELTHWPPDYPTAVQLRQIIEHIPPDAVVSAQYAASAHIDHRVEIYQFPNPFRIVLYGPDTSLEGTRNEARAERVQYVLLPAARDAQMTADWQAIQSAFTLVASNPGWDLYKRSGPLPPPQPSTAGAAEPPPTTVPATVTTVPG
jgi:uncharacterized membrane protein